MSSGASWEFHGRFSCTARLTRLNSRAYSGYGNGFFRFLFDTFPEFRDGTLTRAEVEKVTARLGFGDTSVAK